MAINLEGLESPPSTPSEGRFKLFFDDSGNLSYIDDQDQVTVVGSGGGSAVPGRVIYVDVGAPSGDGSATAPFPTLQAAIDSCPEIDLSGFSETPPDLSAIQVAFRTIKVSSGRYLEDVVVPINRAFFVECESGTHIQSIAVVEGLGEDPEPLNLALFAFDCPSAPTHSPSSFVPFFTVGAFQIGVDGNAQDRSLAIVARVQGAIIGGTGEDIDLQDVDVTGPFTDVDVLLQNVWVPGKLIGSSSHGGSATSSFKITCRGGIYGEVQLSGNESSFKAKDNFLCLGDLDVPVLEAEDCNFDNDSALCKVGILQNLRRSTVAGALQIEDASPSMGLVPVTIDESRINVMRRPEGSGTSFAVGLRRSVLTELGNSPPDSATVVMTLHMDEETRSTVQVVWDPTTTPIVCRSRLLPAPSPEVESTAGVPFSPTYQYVAVRKFVGECEIAHLTPVIADTIVLEEGCSLSLPAPDATGNTPGDLQVGVGVGGDPADTGVGGNGVAGGGDGGDGGDQSNGGTSSIRDRVLAEWEDLSELVLPLLLTADGPGIGSGGGAGGSSDGEHGAGGGGGGALVLLCRTLVLTVSGSDTSLPSSEVLVASGGDGGDADGTDKNGGGGGGGGVILIATNRIVVVSTDQNESSVYSPADLLDTSLPFCDVSGGGGGEKDGAGDPGEPGEPGTVILIPCAW